MMSKIRGPHDTNLLRVETRIVTLLILAPRRLSLKGFALRRFDLYLSFIAHDLGLEFPRFRYFEDATSLSLTKIELKPGPFSVKLKEAMSRFLPPEIHVERSMVRSRREREAAETAHSGQQ